MKSFSNKLYEANKKDLDNISIDQVSIMICIVAFY